jgi:2-haloacid dehalogenase
MPTLEALAFDVYGTLVDPLGAVEELRRHAGDDADRVARVWRETQLRYTFLLTAMGRYEDFEWVTHRALHQSLVLTGIELSAGAVDELMASYDRLERFDDVAEGLGRLHAAGHTLAILSNGTPRMLERLVLNAGLRPPLEDIVSVDEVRIYKPSPRVYQHAAERLRRPIGEVRLISSNPFDVIGAEAAGMRTAWIDRSGGLFDTLAEPPRMVVRTLVELAEELSTTPPTEG